MEILALGAGTVCREDVQRVLLDQRGWFEEQDYKWNDDGGISRGMGVSYCLIVFFPAVRFALWALGSRCGWNDPAFTWMQGRRRALLAVKNHFIPRRPQEYQRRGAIDELSQLARDLPHQEMLHASLGQLLLEDNQLEEAFGALTTALKSPLCVGKDRGGVVYNLACYYAKVHDENACRVNLEASATLKALDVDWMGEDPDLESVRSRDWFIELVRSTAQRGSTHVPSTEPR